jgi:hypothetical protein
VEEITRITLLPVGIDAIEILRMLLLYQTLLRLFVLLWR